MIKSSFPKYLRTLSTAVTVKTGLPSLIVQYLGTWIKLLNSREHNVNLIIDVVCPTDRVEFVRGKFLGCKNNQTTKVVLTLMIKSIRGNYLDVVVLIPFAKLNAQFLYSKYTLIMITLYQIRFIVMVVLVDNHPVNRKLFTHFLCGGELHTSIYPPTQSIVKFSSSSVLYVIKKKYL
uniref:Uncharacterized protein n=1 Tax=Lepeophtheirus salmonis TaxID=72036 RepID=A0A0K2U3P6_LEPSM